MTLPPLPPPFTHLLATGSRTTSIYVWTADAVRAYGEACAAAERERCALLCESTYPESEDGVIVQRPCFDGGADCALGIRAMRETP